MLQEVQQQQAGMEGELQPQVDMQEQQVMQAPPPMTLDLTQQDPQVLQAAQLVQGQPLTNTQMGPPPSMQIAEGMEAPPKKKRRPRAKAKMGMVILHLCISLKLGFMNQKLRQSTYLTVYTDSRCSLTFINASADWLPSSRAGPDR